jgi:serine phosphatase RsbU (regulator of sigma subunit)
VLLLLTDGLMDAVRPDGERFGMDRLKAVVASGPGDPSALVDALVQATTAFTGKRRQADDQTLLAVTLK